MTARDGTVNLPRGADPLQAPARGSSRLAGLLLVTVPVLTFAALALFPGYDARSRYFVDSFPNIVSAGGGYLASLGLLVAVGLTVAALAATFHGMWGQSADGTVPVVVWGLGVSAVAFVAAGLSGVPVFVWAQRAAAGSEPVTVMAIRSEAWAVFSQTSLLMGGLGGLVVGMSALGVLSVRRRLIPRPDPHSDSPARYRRCGARHSHRRPRVLARARRVPDVGDVGPRGRLSEPLFAPRLSGRLGTSSGYPFERFGVRRQPDDRRVRTLRAERALQPTHQSGPGQRAQSDAPERQQRPCRS